MYIINSILHCFLYTIHVRNSEESPVLSSNDCFIKEPTFSTGIGIEYVVLMFHSI
jgi:hypothetical protein